jgi:hypothetical protein
VKEMPGIWNIDNDVLENKRDIFASIRMHLILGLALTFVGVILMLFGSLGRLGSDILILGLVMVTLGVLSMSFARILQALYHLKCHIDRK